jgi:hypothetical protein
MDIFLKKIKDSVYEIPKKCEIYIEIAILEANADYLESEEILQNDEEVRLINTKITELRHKVNGELRQIFNDEQFRKINYYLDDVDVLSE